MTLRKIPTFYLPQPLAFRWFVPLEALGFQVNLDVEEQHINAQKQLERYRGGSVTWKGLKVVVAPQLGFLGFSNLRFLLGYIGRENAPLLDMIERILLASGARASQDAPSIHCKKLYLLSEIPNDIFTKLGGQSPITALKLPWRYRNRQNIAKPIDYIGTITNLGILVDVYSGPVLDVFTDTEIYYIALDYETSLFKSLRLYDTPIKNIEAALVVLDAMPLDFTQI